MSKFKYYEMKDKVRFKLNSKVDNPVLVLKAEVEELKTTVTKTK